jgi:resuscitation-promoting factor RpfB
MRDYTSRSRAQQTAAILCRVAFCAASVLLVGSMAACAGPRATAASIALQVDADGGTTTYPVPSGSTVQQALASAGVQLGELDRVDPPVFTVLTQDAAVRITRVTERFELESETLPFERQTIRNEALPEGETRLLQPGVNGAQETTYRILEEEGIEVSRTPVKTTIQNVPIPEIIMVGAQAAFSPVPVEGTLAYLSGTTAWVMSGDSGNRRPLLLEGKLDGRVFKLSPDGAMLLYTVEGPEDDPAIINTLWAVVLSDPDPTPIDLRAENIVHFADFSPTTGKGYRVAYSTAESSPGSPGWQANNDLAVITFASSGTVLDIERVLDASSGGPYGWWGTTFAWSSDGTRLAYSRPDGIGIVDLVDAALEPSVDMTPYQSLGDWAWVPGLAWGHDGRTLYFVDHGPPTGLEGPAASPVFDVAAQPGRGGPILKLAQRTGMFAYPAVSPAQQLPGGEIAYRLAFLQALSPLESQTSTYQLVVMDRDGSNQTVLFPASGEVGLAPRPVVWSPDALRLGLIHRGDVWIVDASTGVGQRLTGDGQTLALDWKQ